VPQSAADRARTLAYGVAAGELLTAALPDAYQPLAAHGTDEDGRPLLLVPAASEAVVAVRTQPDLAATLHVWDVVPIPLADRVRGQVWVHGWLTEVPADRRRAAALRISRLHPRPELLDSGGWALLAMEVGEVELCDLWGEAALEPEQYLAGLPDPFVAIEHRVLAHLDGGHREELAALARSRLGPQADQAVVRPLGLDRHGLWLRCTGLDRVQSEPADLRVDFPVPVRDLHGMQAACRALFGATIR
jgi:uncharacterized protein DUF2470